MSGTGQRKDVSFFRSHYIVILCVGVVLFTAPQWIKALLEGHFGWTYLYEWASKLGEAAIIGVVVGYFLDIILMKSVDRHGQAVERQVLDQHLQYTTVFNASITELKRDVFLERLASASSVISRLFSGRRSLRARFTEIPCGCGSP
jgi:hypothetical protein